MVFFKIIAIISGAIAGLCMLALPLWLLGVPAVENQYARGWRMGLNVLLIYPVVWLFNYVSYFVMRNRIGEQSRLRWQLIAGSIALVILLIAIVQMLQAFETMG